MKKIKIIISGDYEIFGNGTGDVIECMIKPTYNFLKICEKHGAKYTIFMEMCEYWAFKNHSMELEKDLGYVPHEEIERQLKDAIERGHDVQLHLHPQWLGAEYQNGEWNLNYEYLRLPKLPNGLGPIDNIYSLRGIFHKGKKDLEKMLRGVDKNYECYAFRAGWFCIQPESDGDKNRNDVFGQGVLQPPFDSNALQRGR